MKDMIKTINGGKKGKYENYFIKIKFESEMRIYLQIKY